MIRVFKNSLRDFKEGIMNMGRLLNTEFSRTNLPP
jgi:hypothetical protein